jgi:tetratricopeptide (TPR) repeat protein
MNGNPKQNTAKSDWTSVQAYTLAVVCLLAGIASGWFLRGSQSPAVTVDVASANMSPSASEVSGGAMGQPTPDQMKHMADKQAEPLLAQLKNDQNNPDLLANVGNIYYDTQQFPAAIEYYQRALKTRPNNAAIRTDMATAYWYLGNADDAIRELNRALTYEPNKPNTLFNLGIVKWQGKMDVEGALTVWQKLLDTNPNYENRQKVTELMAQAKKHAGIKPGTQAKALPQ